MIWFVLGLICFVCLVIFLCALNLSGKISREEEKLLEEKQKLPKGK